MSDSSPDPALFESSIDRRRFLELGGAAAFSPMLGGLGSGLHARFHSASNSNSEALGQKKTVVAIYLRGGADALNIIVPWSDSNYRRLRPGIGVPAKADTPQQAVWKLDERFGLHPALLPLREQWEKKRFAPVVCVGSHHPTRSHFDAQDFMEYAAPGHRGQREGWLNRYLQLDPTASKEAAQLRGVAMQKLLPRALRGSVPVLAVPNRRPRDEDALLEIFDELYGKEPAMSGGGGDAMTRKGEPSAATSVGRETIDALRKLQAILEEKGAERRREKKGKKSDRRSPSARGSTYPRGSFGRRLQRLADLIRADAGLEVAALDLPGWDTHNNQGGATGTMARRLADLGGGLAAFCQDLGDRRMERVLVLVMTEFGRTCRENGNRGTDHGHGSFLFALGGGVDGGKVHGEWPGLDDKKLYQGRDLRVTTDFRDLFHQALVDFADAKLPKEFFPGFKPQLKATRILK